jgi:hypothetical protein
MGFLTAGKAALQKGGLRASYGAGITAGSIGGLGTGSMGRVRPVNHPRHAGDPPLSPQEQAEYDAYWASVGRSPAKPIKSPKRSIWQRVAGAAEGALGLPPAIQALPPFNADPASNIAHGLSTAGHDRPPRPQVPHSPGRVHPPGSGIGAATAGAATAGAAAAAGASGDGLSGSYPKLNPIGQDTAATATGRLLGEAPGTSALHSAQQGLSGQSAASQYWNGVAGKFNYSGGPNRAAQAYDDLRGSRPDFQNDPGLSQDYDLAEKRATNKLNQEFAARGAYGSSVSQGQIAAAVSGLEAEKANREADYRLRNFAEQRAWGTAAGELGRGGDVTDLGQDQMGLSTMLGGSQVANAADNSEQGRAGLRGQLALGETAADTQRLAAAAGVAIPTEQLSLNEQNSAFDNISGTANQISGTVGQYVNSLTQDDLALLMNMVNAGITESQMKQIWAQNHTQQEMDQFAGVVGSIGSFFGFGGKK